MQKQQWYIQCTNIEMFISVCAELESKGYKWLSGGPAGNWRYGSIRGVFKERTVVICRYDGKIAYGNLKRMEEVPQIEVRNIPNIQ